MNYKTLSRLHDVTQAYGIGTKLAIAVAYLGHKAGSAPFMDLKEAGVLPDYISCTKDIVITSYSIHYTKLYEAWVTSCSRDRVL